MASLAVQPPLVGRENEKRFLEDRLIETIGGKGSVVLLAGEAGIGKSRLAENLSQLAETKDCHLMMGKCVPGAPTAYLPFLDALEDYFTSDTRQKPSTYQRLARSMKRAAPEMVTAAPIVGDLLKATTVMFQEYRKSDSDPRRDMEQTLHSTLSFLRNVATKKPVLMILEDMQWADTASIQMLHFLARNSTSIRTLFIATYRSEEVSFEEPGHVHPLLQSLRIMRRERVCHEIFLQPLKKDEIAEAIQGVIGRIDSELASRIAAESDGNPLFAIETAKLLVSTGSIALQEGTWKASGMLRVEIPSTVKEVILRRIAQLSKRERQILDLAAVMGTDFDPTVLAEAVKAEKLELLESLDSIDKNFQIVGAQEGLFRFNHEKVRQVIYEEISPHRRKELHRIIAQTLEKRLPEETLLSELSLHFSRAEDKEKCAKYSLLAGQNSIRKAAALEAATYFERALASLEGNSSMEVKLEALEGLADANVAMGRYEQAITLYNSFLETPLNHASRADLVRVLRKASECYAPTRLTVLSKALDLLDQAEKLGKVETVENGRIKRERGRLAVFTGAYDDAERYYFEAEKEFERFGATEDLAKILVSYSYLDLTMGRGREALDKAKKASAHFSTLQIPSGRISAGLQLGDAHLHLGMVADAVDDYGKVIELASNFGRYATVAWAHVDRALAHYSVDQFEFGKLEAAKASENALKTESTYLRAFTDVVLSLCETRLNRLEQSEKLSSSALEAIGTIWNSEIQGDRTPLRGLATLALAELLAAKRDWPSSNGKFRESLELLRHAVYGPLFEPLAQFRYGEALLAQGRWEDAAEQFASMVRTCETLGNRTQAEKASKFLQLSHVQPAPENFRLEQARTD